MSSRHLRRLQKQQPAAAKSAEFSPTESTSDDSDSEEVPFAVATKSTNPFAQFLTHEQEAVAEKSDSSTNDEDDDALEIPDARQPVRSRRQAAAATLSEDLEGLSFGVAASSTETAEKVPMSECSLLRVAIRKLNFAHELQRTFGSKKTAPSTRSLHASVRNNAAKFGANLLVDARPQWVHLPRPAIEMHIVKNDAGSVDDGTSVFAFEHGAKYRSLQLKFIEVAETNDPSLLTDLLHLNPQHIDCLLALSDVCRVTGDAATAADLVERALWGLQRVLHPLFVVRCAEGRARLSYATFENRAFFLALFRHMQWVMRKGCWETAFEIGKLLYALDPTDDPLGMRLLVDFLAVRAHAFTFVAEFAILHADHRLDLLPNWAFSAALALFLKAKEENDGEGEGENENGKRQKAADAALATAICRFPHTLRLLNVRCNAGIDRSPQICRSLAALLTAEIDAAASRFNASERGLHNLERLYVERAYAAYKAPEICRWLLRVASSLSDDQVQCAEHAANRRNNYAGAPRSVYRHLLLADVETASFALPDALAAVPIRSFNLLPDDSAAAASVPSYIDAAWTRICAKNSYAAAGSSSLSLFVRSLLPSFSRETVASTQASGGMLASLRSQRTATSSQPFGDEASHFNAEDYEDYAFSDDEDA